MKDEDGMVVDHDDHHHHEGHLDHIKLPHEVAVLQVVALGQFLKALYNQMLGKGSKKNPGKLSPFAKPPSDPTERTIIYPLFFWENEPLMREKILHLVPSKNLYFCFCYISFICPRKAKI